MIVWLDYGQTIHLLALTCQRRSVPAEEAHRDQVEIGYAVRNSDLLRYFLAIWSFMGQTK